MPDTELEVNKACYPHPATTVTKEYEYETDQGNEVTELDRYSIRNPQMYMNAMSIYPFIPPGDGIVCGSNGKNWALMNCSLISISSTAGVISYELNVVQGHGTWVNHSPISFSFYFQVPSGYVITNWSQVVAHFNPITENVDNLSLTAGYLYDDYGDIVGTAFPTIVYQISGSYGKHYQALVDMYNATTGDSLSDQWIDGYLSGYLTGVNNGPYLTVIDQTLTPTTRPKHYLVDLDVTET